MQAKRALVSLVIVPVQTKFFSSEPSVSADVASPPVTGADFRGASGVRPIAEDDRRRFKQSFADEGYFIVRNVVSKEKLSVLRTTLMECGGWVKADLYSLSNTDPMRGLKSRSKVLRR